MLRVAVVTPYHRESDDILRQCHESVSRQTLECHHVLVADGFGRDFFDAAPRTRHVRLPQAHDDNGNTPRAIGGVLADRQGFDAVVYLDADNWYEPGHVEAMIAGLRPGRPLVACKRNFVDAGGQPLGVREHEEELHRHVDTSCWLIARPAFALLTAWLMPKPLSPVCDRVFFHKAVRSGFGITAADCRTVNFRTRYGVHYGRDGRAAPDGAKSSADIIRAANDYLASAAGAAAFRDAMGFELPEL